MSRRACILCAGLAVAAVAALAAPGVLRTTMTLAWDYPDADADAFYIYSSPDLKTPARSWTILTNAPGGTNREITIPIPTGARFYVCTASNFFGESPFSNECRTPAGPATGTLRIR